jgi:hypothetical protein
MLASLVVLSGCATGDRYAPKQVRGQVPQKPEYVLRNGEKVPFQDGKLQDGDVLKLGEGVYDLAGFYNASVMVVGAGIDKTFVVRPLYKQQMGIAGGKEVVVKNLSLLHPGALIHTNKKDKTIGSIIYLNVKVYGFISPERTESHRYMPESVIFLFSQVEYDLSSSREYKDSYTVALSWLNNASHDPISPESRFSDKGLGTLKDTWLKESRFESPDSAHNIQLFNRLHSQLRAMSIESSASADVEDVMVRAFEAASREIGSLNTDGIPKSIDVAAVNESLRQAERFRKGGNLFLELFALKNAKEASLNRPDENLSRLIELNSRKISSAYGCNISYRRSDGNKDTSVDHLQKLFVRIYRRHVAEVSVVASKLGSKDSACALEIVADRDSYIGGQTGKKVVSNEQIWKEDPEVKAMRERYRAAASRAAEQAAKAQFTNSLDRLQSTAKQLSENRNKIESRSDGLYLVTNNRSVKGNSAADTKSYQDKVDQANKAVGEADSINGGMIKDGTVTTSEFYVTEVSYIQYKLRMKAGVHQELYEFPLEMSEESSGPCIRSSYSASSLFDGTRGPYKCTLTEYRADNAGARYDYISKYLVAPTDQFILERVYPKMIKEVQEKLSKNDAESKLDGIILASIFGDNVQPPEEYEALMKKVFGYSIPLLQVQQSVLAL